MAAALGHDIGHTLWAKRDRCGEPLMAFGRGAEARPELEAMIEADGWHHPGGDGWLCQKCAADAVRSVAPGSE